MPTPDSIVLTLPEWMPRFIGEYGITPYTPEARMRLVIAMAAENVRNGTGGPFAAGVFDPVSGELVAPGVNRVVPLNCSLAHAEMIAIGLAQRRLGTFDLGSRHNTVLELVTTTEPCAMCLGAIPWSGIRRLVCGSTDADARAVGFEEGAKPADWIGHLEKRGISVTTGVLRDEAEKVLRNYAESGGLIYNGSEGFA